MAAETNVLNRKGHKGSRKDRKDDNINGADICLKNASLVRALPYR
jgi:hypothetical protein